MNVKIREAEYLDQESGYFFRVKTSVNFGVVVSVECQSLLPGLFEDICSNFAGLVRSKMVSEAYFLGIEAYEKKYGKLSSPEERKACGIIADTFRKTIRGE